MKSNDDSCISNDISSSLKADSDQNSFQLMSNDAEEVYYISGSSGISADMSEHALAEIFTSDNDTKTPSNSVKTKDSTRSNSDDDISQGNVAEEESLAKLITDTEIMFRDKSNGEISSVSSQYSRESFDSLSEIVDQDGWYEGSAETLAHDNNLVFPDNVSCRSTASSQQVKVGLFSVDLNNMRSLRLFFRGDCKGGGQLVITSRDSQYKIFHFHQGGLDRLEEMFHTWNNLVKPSSDVVQNTTEESQERSQMFSVCRPKVSSDEFHPDEGKVPPLTAEDWPDFFSLEGQIENQMEIRLRIFHGGLEAQLRSCVWPFLLKCYDFDTSFVERQQMLEENRQLYQRLSEKRAVMEGEALERFRRDVSMTVEKDVVRTDRRDPCFAGPENRNLAKMTNILLNFALHRPDIGYSQGMSDILSPILAEVRCEPDAFWCFSSLMEKTFFITSPNDVDMDRSLLLIRELLRLFAPKFYRHTMQYEDGPFLLFAHRCVI